MLNTKKKVVLEGYSKAGNVNAQYYRAEIDSENPQKVNYTISVLDQAAYKENRETCKEDMNDFEEMMYKVQADMEGEKEKENAG